MTNDNLQINGNSSSPVTGAAHTASAAVESAVKPQEENATVRSVLMACAGASLVASIGFKLAGRNDEALFVGQWVPTFLIVGLWMQQVRGDIATQP